MKVLLLAGTTEATQLVTLLAGEPDVEVTASFAGRTRSPRRLAPASRVRVGGFGGVEALADEIRREGYDAVVDATHPFARRMPHNAAAAAELAGVPRLRLLRPPWAPGPGDTWHRVADLAAAAVALGDLGARRVLLTTGRLELSPFVALAAAGGAGARFVMRSIETPDPQPLAGAVVVLGRGPFSVDDELALLREHRIDVVVSKNSGGSATEAKLVAARQLGLPVVMVDRPPPPPGPLVETPAAAVTWLRARG